MRSLAMLYESGREGVSKDEDEAARWYSRAASRGDQRSQMRLRHTEGSAWRGQALSNRATTASKGATGFKTSERSIEGLS